MKIVSITKTIDNNFVPFLNITIALPLEIMDNNITQEGIESFKKQFADEFFQQITDKFQDKSRNDDDSFNSRAGIVMYRVIENASQKFLEKTNES